MIQQALKNFLGSDFAPSFSTSFGTPIPAIRKPGNVITSMKTLYFVVNIRSATK